MAAGSSNSGQLRLCSGAKQQVGVENIQPLQNPKKWTRPDHSGWHSSECLSSEDEFFEIFSLQEGSSFPRRRESRKHNCLKIHPFMEIIAKEEKHEYFKGLEDTWRAVLQYDI